MTPELATNLMRVLHGRLRDDQREMGAAQAVVDELRRSGTFDTDTAILWSMALRVCPGHDGRSWCAYCGEIPAVSEEESL